MDFRETIDAFASEMGLAAAPTDDDGSITFLFDETHEVTFSPVDGGDILFQCEIGEADLLGEKGCRALLEASFAETGGAAFAIHRALGKVVLWIRHGEFASLASFRKSIDDFLAQVVAWKKRLADGDFSAAPDARAAGEGEEAADGPSVNFPGGFMQV